MTRDLRLVLVTLSELKALFFVKDLDGNRTYTDHQVIGSNDRRATGAKRLKLPSATESSSWHSRRPTRGHASCFTSSLPIRIATTSESL